MAFPYRLSPSMGCSQDPLSMPQPMISSMSTSLTTWMNRFSSHGICALLPIICYPYIGLRKAFWERESDGFGAGMESNKGWIHGKMELQEQTVQSNPVQTGLMCSRPRTKLAASSTFPASISKRLLEGTALFVSTTEWSSMFHSLNQKQNLISLLVIGTTTATRSL